ncbi:hypothetical protein KKG41_01210 [Patescibacteria group bacterium]|nr:hypothetical protein [Patescibacteria group bacterium]MBU1890437.1 hypothetical protein [Patescibacteria group bacterium]
MKKIFLVVLIVMIAYVIFVLINNDSGTIESQLVVTADQQPKNEPIDIKNNHILKPPLDRASERVTNKEFGVFITPSTSPIQPERFQGYHTGTDFEIFPEEFNQDVSIIAICTGGLISKRTVSGYGGVAVQACKLNNEPIIVIYGHLKLSSIANINDELETGQVVGVLGADKSIETDGERKHLHLGMHKGSTINLLGYVGSEPELTSWIDPCLYVCYDS